MELSKTDLGALNADVRVAANSMKFGKSFEEAMKRMARDLGSELIIRYTDLVIQASYSGGSVADLILKSSEDMRSILAIERENGLIIGKISEGDSLYGLKHSTILIGGCYIACVMMLLPAGAGGDVIDANVAIISGFDQEGLVGLPLKDPIVVSVTDLEGNPLSRTTVTFGIDPGGTVEPETVKTNEEGKATVRVVLGAAEGTYAVSATVGETTARTTAVALAMGG